MPTYEYECRSCKHRFDRFQPITARPAGACPKCRGTTRRLISGGGGLLFKGSGFYATDYRSAGYKREAAAECKSSPGTDCGKGKKPRQAPVRTGCAETRGDGASAKPAD